MTTLAQDITAVAQANRGDDDTMFTHATGMWDWFYIWDTFYSVDEVVDLSNPVDTHWEAPRITDDPLTYEITVSDITSYVQAGAGHSNITGGDGDDELYGCFSSSTGAEDEEDGDDLIHGGNGNDRVYGHAGQDQLYGDAGDDTLIGHSGNDYLSGGFGNDSLSGGEGDDFLVGDDGDDHLNGGSGEDVLSGWLGDDYLYGGDGQDRLFGNDGIDFLNGEGDDDLLVGGDGNDTVWGGGGNDTLYGDDGDDEVKGGGGDDIVYGGIGNDTLSGDDGYDIIYAGAGDDMIEDGDLIYCDIGDDTVTSGVDIFGGDGDDDLTSYGGTVKGEAGEDTIYVQDGKAKGGKQADTIVGFNSNLFGDQGDDTITVNQGSTNVKYKIYGGSGNDLIRATAGGDADHISKVFGEDGDDQLIDGGGFVRLYGGVGDDILAGAGPKLDGGDDNDSISGTSTSQTLIGGKGNDVIDGNGGDADLIKGGKGKDKLYLDKLEEGENFSSTDHMGTLRGDKGDDKLFGIELFSSEATLDGGVGNDKINTWGKDTLIGGDGDDIFNIYQGAYCTIASEPDEDGTDIVNFADYDKAEHYWTYMRATGDDFADLQLSGSGLAYGSVTFEDFLDGGSPEFIQFGGSKKMKYELSNDSEGTDGNDFLWREDDDHMINAGDGNDFIAANLTEGEELPRIINGGAGNDWMFGSRTNFGDGDQLYGGKGNDVLNGVGGNDYLSGGKGKDVYIVDPVQMSTIDDQGKAGEKDTLSLWGSLELDDVSFARDGDDLTILEISQAGWGVRITDYFTDAGNEIETLYFKATDESFDLAAHIDDWLM